VIKYIDKDDELINVSDDEDLITAYELAHLEMNDSLKFVIQDKKASPIIEKEETKKKSYKKASKSKDKKDKKAQKKNKKCKGDKHKKTKDEEEKTGTDRDMSAIIIDSITSRVY